MVGARGLFLTLFTSVSAFVRQPPHIQSSLPGLFHVARARVYLVRVFIIIIIIIIINNNNKYIIVIIVIYLNYY